LRQFGAKVYLCIIINPIDNHCFCGPGGNGISAGVIIGKSDSANIFFQLLQPPIRMPLYQVRRTGSLNSAWLKIAKFNAKISTGYRWHSTCHRYAQIRRMALSDKQLICAQCGTTFVFSQAEQERYKIRGFDAPRRCPLCRKSRAKLHDEPQWQQRQRRSRRNHDDNFDQF
jgi:hypothetical protein